MISGDKLDSMAADLYFSTLDSLKQDSRSLLPHEATAELTHIFLEAALITLHRYTTHHGLPKGKPRQQFLHTMGCLNAAITNICSRNNLQSMCRLWSPLD